MEAKKEEVVKEEIKKVEEPVMPEYLVPTMIETPATEEPIAAMMMLDEDEMDMEEENEKKEEASKIIHWDLAPETVQRNFTNEFSRTTTVDKKDLEIKDDAIVSKSLSDKPSKLSENTPNTKSIFEITAPVSAASGGYLARPSNIYAESKPEEITSITSAEKPVSHIPPQQEEEILPDLQLVMRDDIPAADMPLAHQTLTPLTTTVEDLPMADEAEDQKRRAAERLQKLRNLSFNFSATDPNNEFETVPAYIRRNMELYNSFSAAENFYSNIEVKKEGDNKATLSTINTFLDGKKPD